MGKQVGFSEQAVSHSVDQHGERAESGQHAQQAPGRVGAAADLPRSALLACLPALPLLAVSQCGVVTLPPASLSRRRKGQKAPGVRLGLAASMVGAAFLFCAYVLFTTHNTFRCGGPGPRLHTHAAAAAQAADALHQRASEPGGPNNPAPRLAPPARP